jgi:hypothetical protein
MIPRIVVSFGNRKLPKDTMIFNLPARVTCPGRTELCSRICYALKAERQYKAVLPARRDNLAASRDPGFPERMIALIKEAAKRGRIKRFRVHESGDFYNQSYLNAWYTIARAVPGIRFYAYTKSYSRLDFSARPANFWLLASDADRIPAGCQHSFNVVGRKAAALCGGNCRVCDACFTGSGRKITVNQH